MERIILPKNVEIIIDKLNQEGYQAYVVGGCVRDSLLGATPHDWDICTSALPEETMRVFSDKKIIPTGLKHGTVTIVLDGSEYEVTTFRIDGEYKDGRHPDQVEFVNDLKLDLMRRDFTINAMAYSHKTGIIDYFGGCSDLCNKIIKCVGNPTDRFNEDALRILRALRFATRLGFDIDKLTREAMLSMAGQLGCVSMERINSELIKAISPLEIKENLMLDLLHVLKHVIPELEDPNRAIKIKSFNRIRPEVRLPLIFDFSDELLYDVLRRMKFSNAIIDRSMAISKYGNLLIENLYDKTVTKNVSNKTDSIFPDDNIAIKRMVFEAGCANSLFAISYARCKYEGHDKFRLIKFGNRLCKYCASEDAIFSLRDLKINGNDLIAAGYSGKEIGKCLNELLSRVFDCSIKNDFDSLISEAYRMRGRHGNL